MLDIAYQIGLSPLPMRGLLCTLLRKRADPQNWSEWPNVANECEDLIQSCEWYEFYDVIEGIYKSLDEKKHFGLETGQIRHSEKFSAEINRYFRRGRGRLAVSRWCDHHAWN